MTPLRMSAKDARRLKGKSQPAPERTPKDEPKWSSTPHEHCPPNAWSEVLDGPRACHDCDAMVHMRVREMDIDRCDGQSRCVPCLIKRRRAMREEWSR